MEDEFRSPGRSLENLQVQMMLFPPREEAWLAACKLRLHREVGLRKLERGFQILRHKNVADVSKILFCFKQFRCFLRGGLDLFFPPVCLLCGRWDGLFEQPTCCLSCWQLIRAPRRLGFPTTRKHAARAFCAGAYVGNLRKLVLRAKFNADPLAVSLLSAFVGSTAPTLGLRSVDCVTSIPPQRARLRKRGIDLPGYLAEKLAKRLQIPYDRDLLMRVRSTRSQRDVSKTERLKNLRGAFQAFPQNGITSVLIVDDVFTTGATAWAAVTALRQAGIHRVDFLAAAAA